MAGFVDRSDAGERLGRHLAHLREERPVVVGLPRGGVPVAAAAATVLGAEADVILVRKLGVPGDPELAMGAVGEGGVLVRNEAVIRRAGVSEAGLEAARRDAAAALESEAGRWRVLRPPLVLRGRAVVLVDDGVATGATVVAAAGVARARGVGRLVVAVPVAPPGWARTLGGVADEVVVLDTPRPFLAVGHSYRDFSPVDDETVGRLLAAWASPAGPPPAPGT